MNVLSFSLYGTNPIYTIGAIKNAKLKQEIYPDWEMRVYYNNTVPQEIVQELKTFKNVKLIDTKQDNKFVNSLWRFLPASEVDIDFFISRDLDSRISERDKASTEEWISSGKKFHIIRDHPVGHGWLMNAGMWGCKGGTILQIDRMIEQYVIDKDFSNKAIDQCFLRDVIHPMAIKDLLLHDEYFNYERIGQKIGRDRKIDDFAFIGESVDENDNPRGDQRSPIRARYRG